MHDAIGRSLKVGDRVLIPAVVTETMTTEDYCNVSVETVAGRRPPDEHKERISAINTGVMYRANDGDQNPGLFG